MGFLQILSQHAVQNITYHCKGSVAYFNEEKKTHRYGLKLLAWNDAEITAKGSQRLRYEAIEDECRVIFNIYFQNNNFCFFYVYIFFLIVAFTKLVKNST